VKRCLHFNPVHAIVLESFYIKCFMLLLQYGFSLLHILHSVTLLLLVSIIWMPSTNNSSWRSSPSFFWNRLHDFLVATCTPFFLHYFPVALGTMVVHFPININCYAEIMCIKPSHRSLCTGLIKNMLPNHEKKLVCYAYPCHLSY
jgi:hypothetical protein